MIEIGISKSKIDLVIPTRSNIYNQNRALPQKRKDKAAYQFHIYRVIFSCKKDKSTIVLNDAKMYKTTQ